MTLYNKLSLTLPEGFDAISKEETPNFFGTTAMDHVFALKGKNAVIGITRPGNSLTDQEIEERIQGYQRYYSRMAPGFVLGEMCKKTISGQCVAFMTFKSNAPTRDLYNILAITLLDDQEVLISCSCDIQDAVTYMYPFLHVLESISFDEGEKNVI